MGIDVNGHGSEEAISNIMGGGYRSIAKKALGG